MAHNARVIVALMVLTVMLTAGCAGEKEADLKKYEASFLSLFDTLTVMVGYAEDEGAFRKTAEELRGALEEYHQLYDIYHDYPGINNLKTVNDNAGIAPVKVDRRIIELLLFCKEIYGETEGAVNIAMGSVLRLWHDAREEGIDDPLGAVLPDMSALKQAAEHMDPNNILIDQETGTVFLADGEMSLDVGAVAKGYAAEQVIRDAPKGVILSVGGNVCANGEPPEGRWTVGLKDPCGGDAFFHRVSITEEAVVTSGDAQRRYTVEGKAYHHLIDPQTLMPGDRWRAVTVICGDSGMGDALSTALFLLPREQGAALLKKYHAEGIWIDLQGKEYYSEGFSEYLKN